MSVGDKITLRILKLVRGRELVARSFRNPPRNTAALDLRKFNKSLQPEIWAVDGFKVVTLQGQPSSGVHVVFLHGGGYILEASPFHRQFAAKLAGEHGLSVSLVDYPKSPEHTFRTTHAVVLKAYRRLLEKYPDHDFRLLGDSAGGGLALAFLQALREQKITPLPGKTTLLSPWLDLTMSHPQVPDYIKRDQVLSLAGLQYAAGLYAGGEDPLNPLLSPLFGDLSNLGKIQLIFGSEEIFVPDCRALIARIQDATGTEVDWEVGKNKIHDWPIFPFRESRAVLNQIARFLLSA